MFDWDKTVDYSLGDEVIFPSGSIHVISPLPDTRPRIKFYNNGVHVEKTKHICIQEFYKFAFQQWYWSESPT